jgi:hypothetical protein
MAGKQLGSLTVPIYASLPASAPTGAIGMVGGVLYNYTGSGWASLIPVIFGYQSTQPSVPTGLPYFYVDMSGTDAALYVEDGVSFT